MTDTQIVQQLVANQGKRVVLHLKQADNTLVELEGKIEAASEAGFAFKEKGKSSLDLYDSAQVEEIQVAPEKPKSIPQKKLKPIDVGQARQHLADRHGISMKWIKENTEQAAFAYHQTIDHRDLGHRHEAATEKPTERDEALADDASTESSEPAA